MAFINNPMLVLILRIIQAILAILTLGLTAYVANWWSGYWHAMAPGQINFLLFCAIWSILALLYLAIVPWRMANSGANHKFAILGVEALTMIFWFAGFIALAVFLSDRVCFGHVCSAAKAAAAFGAFEWLVFAITTTMAALHCTRRSHETHSDPKLNMAEGV